MKFLHALDDNAPGAGTLDVSPHGVEEIRQVEHFGFGGGGLNDRLAIGQSGGHHHVVGAQHSGTMGATQIDGRTAQPILGC